MNSKMSMLVFICIMKFLDNVNGSIKSTMNVETWILFGILSLRCWTWFLEYLAIILSNLLFAVALWDPLGLARQNRALRITKNALEIYNSLIFCWYWQQSPNDIPVWFSGLFFWAVLYNDFCVEITKQFYFISFDWFMKANVLAVDTIIDKIAKFFFTNVSNIKDLAWGIIRNRNPELN